MKSHKFMQSYPCMLNGRRKEEQERHNNMTDLVQRPCPGSSVFFVGTAVSLLGSGQSVFFFVWLWLWLWLGCNEKKELDYSNV